MTNDDKITLTPTEMYELPIIKDSSQHSDDWVDTMIYVLKSMKTQMDFTLDLYESSDKNGLDIRRFEK